MSTLSDVSPLDSLYVDLLYALSEWMQLKRSVPRTCVLVLHRVAQEHRAALPPSSFDVAERMANFYLDLMYDVAEWSLRSGARPQGAPVIVKRVALGHGVALASSMPLPRLSRAEYDESDPHNRF